MNRSAEASLLIGAAALAAFGVALVNLAEGGTLDAQVALTFLVFLIAFGGLHLAIRQWAPSASPFLLPLAALLAGVGFIEVYRLRPDLAAQQRWWLLIAAGFGAALLAAVRNTGLAPLRRYRYVFLLATFMLLLLPMLPTGGIMGLRGLSVNGSRLWISFEAGGFQVSFQPGEIAKLTFVIFLASYLAERQPALVGSTRKIGFFSIPEPRQLAPILLAWGASLAVLVYQRDLGASLLLFAIFIAMLYAATGHIAYVTTGLVMFASGAVAAWAVFDHVQRRIDAWIRPFADYEDTGFQIAQSLFAMGTGSLTGSGLGLGRPDLIPLAATDFVFAAVGEELGLAGSVVVIAGFALLVAVAFGIALRARDVFRKMLAAGLAIVLGLQAFLIIAGVVRLLPLTGIALPFMSYGGSALVSNTLLIVLLARISHEERT